MHNTCSAASIIVSAIRYPYARDFPLHNVPFAFITLFELLTLEGWTEVRDSFAERKFIENIVSHGIILL